MGPLPLSDEGFNHVVRQHWRCAEAGRRMLSAAFVCRHGGFIVVACECDPNARLFVVPAVRRELCGHALAVAGFSDEADDDERAID
jgi:hypothetical protein